MEVTRMEVSTTADSTMVFVALKSHRSLCVCDAYSGTTGYEVANKRYQRLKNYANLKNDWAIFLKRLRSRDMPLTSEKANMHNRAGLPLTDRPTLEAQEVTTEGVYRLPHAIY